MEGSEILFAARQRTAGPSVLTSWPIARHPCFFVFYSPSPCTVFALQSFPRLLLAEFTMDPDTVPVPSVASEPAAAPSDHATIEATTRMSELTLAGNPGADDTPSFTSVVQKNADAKTNVEASAEVHDENASRVDVNDQQKMLPGLVHVHEDEPVEDNSVVEQPVAGMSVTDQSAVEPPIEQPAAEQPILEQPAAEQPIAEPPVTEQPLTEPSVTEQPLTDQPAVDQPTVEQPTTNQAVTHHPATVQPSASDSIADQSGADKQNHAPYFVDQDPKKASNQDSNSSDVLSSSDDSSEADAHDQAELSDAEIGEIDDIGSFARDIMNAAAAAGPESAPRTANEREYWKAFTMPKIEMQESHEISELGIITSIVDGYAVVVDPAESRIPGILDNGTPVCTKERKLLGQIEDTILTVQRPQYWFGTNDVSKAKEDGVEVGAKVYYVSSLATWVDLPNLQRQKHYDTSNLNDEEVDDDGQEFSNDEDEAAHRKAKSRRNKTPSAPVLKYDDDDDDDGAEGGYNILRRPAPGEMPSNPGARRPLDGRQQQGRPRNDRGPHQRRGRGNFHERFRGGVGRGGSNRNERNNNQRNGDQGQGQYGASPSSFSPGQQPAPFPYQQSHSPVQHTYPQQQPAQYQFQPPFPPIPPPPPPGYGFQWPGGVPPPPPPPVQGMPPSMQGGAVPPPVDPQTIALHSYFTIPGPWNNYTLPQQQNQAYPPWWNHQGQ